MAPLKPHSKESLFTEPLLCPPWSLVVMPVDFASYTYLAIPALPSVSSVGLPESMLPPIHVLKDLIEAI